MSREKYTFPVEAIIYGNFVRYDRLDGLINAAFSDSNATEINLYIDLYPIIKTVFSDSYRVEVSDYMTIAPLIMEMCGHYRAYFKQLGVHTKIFLIFSYNICDINRKLAVDYNSKFYKKYTKVESARNMVDTNMDILEVMCPFLPDIYFLKTEFESSVLMDYLILTGNKNPNLIISKDIYPSQLTYLHQNTAFVKPKKLNGEDLSVIIPPCHHHEYSDTFWSVYCNARGNDMNLSRSSVWIDPCNFTSFAALTRFPERSLKMLTNATMANKMIFNTIGKEPVKVSIDSIFDKIGDSNVSRSIAKTRQQSLDVVFFREIFNNSTEPSMIHLDNLQDPDTVNEICSKYFKNNPVDLSRL